MTSMKEREQEPCHPNLTEGEEQNYDIDPSKIKEEENVSILQKKTERLVHEGSVNILIMSALASA